MTDLAPAAFGLIGVGIGGVASAWVERGKFKRERAAITASERRAFRIDTLTKIDIVFEELFQTGFSLVLRHSEEPSKERLELMRHVGEAQTQVSALAVRIHDEALRQLCSDLSNSLSTTALDMNCYLDEWNEATKGRTKALEAIGTALRDLYK